MHRMDKQTQTIGAYPNYAMHRLIEKNEKLLDLPTKMDAVFSRSHGSKTIPN
jgi:hypothetical protein